MSEPLPRVQPSNVPPSKKGIQALIGASLREQAGVRYTELGARSILNRCNTPRMPDCWTINPYRGCSFGCQYCYARYTHEFLGLDDPLAFEKQIFVKVGAGNTLEREATVRRLRARPIAIGTATDPYQPAEARYRLTRTILEVLGRYRGLQVSITTKSAMIVRDLDLLTRLSERSRLTVHLSLITLDRELARELEPGAPTPSRRLRTLETLSRAGLHVGVFAVPVLPGLTDDDENLRRLFETARDHGAAFVGAWPLFLASASRRRFFDWLGERRPELVPLYRRYFSDGIDIDPRWRAQLGERVERIRQETGLRPAPARPEAARPETVSLQLTLPGIVSGAAATSGNRG